MNNPSMNVSRTPTVLLGGLTFFLLLGCGGQPTKFDPKPNLLTPEGVVENLTVSYQEKNLERYMNNFAESSIFLDDEVKLWDFEVERRLHERMFTRARKIDLTMQPITSKTIVDGSVQSTYSYQAKLVRLSGAKMTASGQVTLNLINGDGNDWKIVSFRERTSMLKKISNPVYTLQDSVDYFPLRVGNSWTYEEQIVPNRPDVEAVVTDSVMLRGNLYYSLQNSGFPFFSNLLRIDSLQRYSAFFIEDSSEHTLFDFTSSIGDSTFFMLPGARAPSVVELINHKDSVEVPAGTFANVLEFLIDDLDSGSQFSYEFAANIGIIRQRGTNQILALKSASVNGNKYPIITSVRQSGSSWTQMKNTFRQGANTRSGSLLRQEKSNEGQ